MSAETKHTAGPWFWSGNSLMASRKTHSTHVMVTKDAPLSPNADDRALIAAAPDLLAALRPFLPAYLAYVETMQNFVVDGETMAERRFSDGERRDSASENAFEELAKVTFDQLAAVAAALARAQGFQP